MLAALRSESVVKPNDRQRCKNRVWFLQFGMLNERPQGLIERQGIGKNPITQTRIGNYGSGALQKSMDGIRRSIKIVLRF